VIIPMTLVPSTIAVFPIASASREEFVGAVCFIAVTPFVYWAARGYGGGAGTTAWRRARSR
jgi:hypothetical protein